MTLNPKKSPLVMSAAFSILAMLASFPLPIWDLGIYEGNPVKGDGFEVLEYIRHQEEVEMYINVDFATARRNSLLRLFGIAVVGGTIGWMAHWVIWGRRAAFVEKPLEMK